MSTHIHGATRAPIQARSDVWCDAKPKFRTARLNFDIPDALLAEVDFKWLMAGQGQRVDPKRFYTDQAYTMDLLQTGLRSESAAVRACAACLLEEIESASAIHRPVAIDSGRRFNNGACSPGSRPVPGLLKRRTAERRQQATTGEQFRAGERIPRR